MGNAVARWWDDAACQTVDPETFFPISSRGLSLLQVARAKVICGNCRVRIQCREYALGTHQEYGVWGGLTEDERRVLSAPVAADDLGRVG